MNRLLLVIATLLLCSGQMCGMVEESPPPIGLEATEYPSGTWLVVTGNADPSSVVTATAWAVGPRLLATNAHVTEAIVAAVGAPGGEAKVFQHETGSIRTVQKVWSHPEYRESAVSFTPDLGLLQVDDDLPVILPLAADEDVKQLQIFDPVSLCGFPGEVTLGVDLQVASVSQFHPRVTCLKGTISSLRPFDSGTAMTPDNSFIIQYDLPTSPGASGSALFNDAGFVVGVHAMGVGQGSSYKFGIRADKLREFIDLSQIGSLPGVNLADLKPTCLTTYYDQAYRFGFNPPPGWTKTMGYATNQYRSHVTFAPSTPALATSDYFFVDVESTTRTDPYAYRNSLISAGAVPLIMLTFWAPADYAAYYFVFEKPATQRMLAECHVYTGNLGFLIRTEVSKADWVTRSSAIEQSLRSICVEPR